MTANTQHDQHPFGHWLAQSAVALLYALLGLLIHRYILSQGIVSVFWPGSGLALAALLIGGRQYTWGVLLGSLLLNGLSNDSVLAISGITVANVLEVRLGFWLITRKQKPDSHLESLSTYLRLVALGGVACVCAAVIGPVSLLLAGALPPAALVNTMLTWWMGDAIGIVLITPLALAWWKGRSTPLLGRNLLEGTLILCITFVVGQIVFLEWFQEPMLLTDTPKGYIMFLFVAFIALRLGPRGTTLVVAIIATQGLAGAYQHLGYFSNDIVKANLSNYWFYMLTLSIVGMAIASTVHAHRQALSALQLKDNALNVAANGVVITDASGRIEWANHEFSHVTGYSASEVTGKNPGALVNSGKQDKSYYKTMWKTILAGEVWRGEIINRRKDGSFYDEEMTITPMRDADGVITHFVALKQDISERIKARKYDQHRGNILEQLAGDAPLINILEAIVLGVQSLNPEMLCSVLLLDEKAQTLGNAVAPSLPDFYNKAIDGLPIGVGVGSCGTSAFTGQRVVVEDIQSHPYWTPYRELAARAELAACWSQPIRSSNNAVLGTFAIYHRQAHLPTAADIGMIEQSAHLASIAIERKRVDDLVNQLAFYDPLTNLPNRRLLTDRLNQVMTANKRIGNYGAVMFLDLDNFKPLNDTHGHAAGDQLLIEAALRLKSSVREMDTVARFGGDEFVVILADLGTDQTDANSQAGIVAGKVRAALSAPYKLKISHDNQDETYVTHVCSASIGVVIFMDHQSRQDEILKWADHAMYRAKEVGRNAIHFYDATQ